MIANKKKSGRKFCSHGDVSIRDFANSTKPANTVKNRLQLGKDVALAGVSNSAAVKKGKPGKVKPSFNTNLEDAALVGDSDSAAVIKENPGKVKPSFNLVQEVQQLKIQEQDWHKQSEPHNEEPKEVKKLSTEDLAWDEKPDEDSEEDLPWYEQPDDNDLEDFHNAKNDDDDDDQKNAGITGLSSDDQCTKKGKEVQNKVAAKKEEIEQYRLRNNLLIHGLKEKLREDTKAQVVDMFQKRMKLNISSEDITLAQRLGKQRPPGKHRNILVTFKTYSDRTKVFNIKKILKSSGIVITEDLTAQRLELYQIMRDQYGEKNTWTQNGKVFWINNSGIRCSATRKADLENTNLGIPGPSSDDQDEEVQNKIAAKERMEQYRLRNNLLIHGVEEKLCEDTTARVVDLFQKHMKLKITSEDISLAERLRKHKLSGEHYDILVTFKTFSDREKVYSLRNKLKSSGIMITEDLTAQRLELYNIVKEKYGEKKTKTLNGRVVWNNEDGVRCSAIRKADLENTN